MLKHTKKELSILSDLFNELINEKSDLESKRDRLVDELSVVNDELRFKTKEMIRIDGLRNEIFDYDKSIVIDVVPVKKKKSFYAKRK